MPIALRSTGTFTERTAETSSNVPYPATVVANDLLVLGGSVFNSGLITTPAGWTAAANFSATANTATPDIIAAILKAVSESGNLAVTHHNNVSAWQILGFSGVDTTTPQDATRTTFDGTGSTVLPSLNVVTAGACLVYIAANVNVANTATPPAGFTETGDRNTGTRDFTMGYKLNVGTGATGTVTVTWSGSGRSVGVLLALRPAAAAGSYGRIHYAATEAPAGASEQVPPGDRYVARNGIWVPVPRFVARAGTGWV